MRVFSVYLALFIFLAIGFTACEEGANLSAPNDVPAESRVSDEASIISIVQSLRDYVIVQNSLHDGQIYLRLDNGKDLLEIADMGLLSRTRLEEDATTAQNLLNNMLAENSELDLGTWVDDNIPDGTSERFCIICKHTATMPPVQLPGGDCTQTTVTTHTWFGIEWLPVGNPTYETNPC